MSGPLRDHPFVGLPLAVIDVESTGLGDDSRLVEVAVIHMTLGSRALPHLALRQRVNPGIPMEPGATKVTGISDADLVDCPPWAEVAPAFEQATEGRVRVAYNAPADYAWLHREGAGGDWPWMDVAVVAKLVDRYERSKALVNVAARRGIVVDAHGAAGDAAALALCIHPLLRDLGTEEHHGFTGRASRAFRTWGDFAAYQRTMALHLERDYCAYLQRKGGRSDRPDCPWHLLEGVALPPWPEPSPPVAQCTSCSQPIRYAIDKAGDIVVQDAMSAFPHLCRLEEPIASAA